MHPLISLFRRWKKLPAWAWGLLGLGGLFLGGLFTPRAETPTLTDGSAVSGIIPPAEMGLSALEVLIKLGFVIGLIYVSLYLLRRWQGHLTGRATRQLRVIETLALTPRQTLHLIRAGSQVLLIGATDQTLTTLGPVDLLPDSAEIPVNETATPSFSSFLIRSLSETAFVSKNIHSKPRETNTVP